MPNKIGEEAEKRGWVLPRILVDGAKLAFIQRLWEIKFCGILTLIPISIVLIYENQAETVNLWK